MLKDFYYDAKYPGDNYVIVDKESCAECLDIMYTTIDAVQQKRLELGLEIIDFPVKELS